MSIENGRSHEDNRPVVEGIPGERFSDMLMRFVAERAAAHQDLVARIEVMGVTKDIVITKEDTWQTLAQKAKS